MAEREQLPVQQARAGDPAAWETLFKRYQMPLYAYVYELLHDEQTSLDVVQEAFLNAFRHLARLREDERFGSWLFGIAHQKCVQRWRKRGREERPLETLSELPGDPDEQPDTLLIREEQEGEFMALVNQLPQAQRSVLLLHYLEEFPLEDIAAITETPLGTVKSRLHYGKKVLRKLVEERPV